MKFDWDAGKAKRNLAKHGVSFEDATAVFFDPDALDAPDIAHSDREDRWAILGRSTKWRLFLVIYVERSEDFIWIISARKATSHEASKYEQTIKNNLALE